MKKLSFITSFFYLYPSFFYALFFLLGASFFIYNKWILLLFFIFALGKKKLILAAAIFLSAYFYSGYFFSDIKKINAPIEGKSLFKIKNIKEIYNFNNKYYLYFGTIKVFESDNLKYRNIQASISSKRFYSPLFFYSIEGTVIPDENYSFHIKTKQKWNKKQPVFSLSKTRFDLKKAFYKYLKKTIKNKNCVDFLHVLITGDNTHKFLSFCFSKIGLQHVLAISGFHFGIFTLFFSFFLKMFLPRNLVIYFLLILVNLYFLFIGPLISVQRAYLMIQMALLAQILNRKYFALNALGISMLIILLINPLSLKNIGFQLSYLCTFAILVSHPVINELFSKIFIKRTPAQTQELNLISKIGLKILDFIKESICLCVSVNIFILPVVLFYFHKFPVLSFIYNLFIPFFIGLSLALVIIGGFCYFLFPLNLLVNSLNVFLTKTILQMITYPPVKLDFYIRNNNIAIEFVIIYLLAVSGICLFLRERLKKDQIPKYCDFI